MFKKLIPLYLAWLVTAALLVWAAVERHPYSFYMLLRWVCCPVLALFGRLWHTKRIARFGFGFFGVLALLYNPIFRTHLDRSTWIGVNWFTIGVIAVAAVVFWRKPTWNARSGVNKNDSTEESEE